METGSRQKTRQIKIMEPRFSIPSQAEGGLIAGRRPFISWERDSYIRHWPG